MWVDSLSIDTKSRRGLGVVFSGVENKPKLGSLLVFANLVFLHAVKLKPFFIQPIFLCGDKAPSNKEKALMNELLKVFDMGCLVKNFMVLETLEVNQLKDCNWIWPPKNKEGSIHSVKMDSLTQQTEYFLRYQLLPELKVKTEYRKKALKWMGRMGCEKKKLGAVHLKFVAGAVGKSNFCDSAWCQFFKDTFRKKENNFILVGEDPLDRDVLNFPNLHFTCDEKLPLSVQLALIQEADFFMGMASGFCQMAIFGTKPYAIFKNPGHHTEEMAKEKIIDQRFPFSLSGQHFITAYETAEVLENEYQRMARESFQRV
jgi:hypothetical protein